jgi:putative ABC transport system ATP-binding protein
LDEDERAKLRAGAVGFVFQAFHLLPGLTALENAMLPLELSEWDSPRAEAQRVLEQVGLGERLEHYPTQLSGGEQQRVAIARAFVGSPRLLFADEPTGNLDQGTGERIIDLLFQLNAEQGTTLVLVTHDPELAGRCDRTLYIRDGRLEGAA